MNNKLEFGIINIDKPEACTSFDVCEKVKKILGCKKTSHFGTLDPMVTGVLPIALNRAVKLTGFFINHDKEYIGEMRMHQEVSLDEIKKVVEEKFLGKIIQLPPVKSRVKRQEREREIKKFEIIEKKGKIVSFHVECQGGTYVRKLCSDLGQELGVGAQMTKLRRTRAGIFREEDSVKLEEVEEKKIMPAEEAIKEVYHVVQVKQDSLKQLLTGKPVHKKDLEKNGKFDKEQIIAIFCKDKFVGMYKVINEGDIVAMPEFVRN